MRLPLSAGQSGGAVLMSSCCLLPLLQYIGFALSLVPFAGMLLVLSAERDERNVAGVKF